MPIKTRAAVAFAPSEPMRIVELDLADPGPGQVRIKLLATGLCHSDQHILDGSLSHRFPAVLGHEGIGEITALGSGVTDFALGDRVIPYLVPDCGVCDFCRSGRTNMCVQFHARLASGETPFSYQGQPVTPFMGLGTFAEDTVVPADMVVKVDRKARPDHACCIGCGVTTGLGSALIRAKVQKGDSVVVFGAGGVGLSVVQGARIAGAGKIIAVDTNPGKAEVARRLGATDFINAKEVENVASEVMGMTGRGADFAFDCVGVAALSEQALDCVNPAWGQAVVVGAMREGSQITTLPGKLMFGRQWTGSFMGGAKRKDVARYVDMYVSGELKLDDVISHTLKLDDINRGFEMMRSGEAVRSVVVYGQ
jgi:S-(hydroxymethyl)glutathione dehydrogenase/alcohol dehydrogenase